MTLHVDGAWSGRSGDTIVQLTDGSVWRQYEYSYSYHHAYRPEVIICNGKMHQRNEPSDPTATAVLNIGIAS